MYVRVTVQAMLLDIDLCITLKPFEPQIDMQYDSKGTTCGVLIGNPRYHLVGIGYHLINQIGLAYISKVD